MEIAMSQRYLSPSRVDQQRKKKKKGSKKAIKKTAALSMDVDGKRGEKRVLVGHTA